MKRYLALILAVLMLVFIAASCDNGEGPKSTGKNTEVKTSGEPVSTGPKEKPWPTEKLPDGTTLKILGRPYAKEDWMAEELNEEAVNDAVYTRKEWLKENYNFECEFTLASDDATWLSMATTAAKADTGSYDLFVGSGRNMATLSQQNYLYDLKTLENIDLDAEWWDKNATNDLSIAGRVFMTSGAIQTCDIRCTYIVYLNKTLLEEKDIDRNPYDLVRNNEWTLDALQEISTDAKNDVDGNGQWTDKDMYGYICENYDSYAMFFCSGESVVTKNADDLPVFSLNTTRAAEYVQRLKDFYTDESTYVNYSANINPIMKDNRALFCGTLVSQVAVYRDMESDFGILPIPKYEASQDRYYHAVSCGTTGSLIGIPVCTSDAEQTSYMVELMARKSVDTVKSAYMEDTVKSRGLRDEDSFEMLDLAVNSRVYDVAYINGWGQAANGNANGWMIYLYYIAGTPEKADQFASMMDSGTESTNKEIQATIDAYMANF